MVEIKKDEMKKPKNSGSNYSRKRAWLRSKSNNPDGRWGFNFGFPKPWK